MKPSGRNDLYDDSEMEQFYQDAIQGNQNKKPQNVPQRINPVQQI
jgi:hypothetical protein